MRHRPHARLCRNRPSGTFARAIAACRPYCRAHAYRRRERTPARGYYAAAFNRDRRNGFRRAIDNVSPRVAPANTEGSKRVVASPQPLLSSFRVWRHRSEIMFGVLVIVLGANRIANLAFGAGESQIPLIVSLRRIFRLGAAGARCPLVRARSRRSGSVGVHSRFRPFCMARSSRFMGKMLRATHEVENHRWRPALTQPTHC